MSLQTQTDCSSTASEKAKLIWVLKTPPPTFWKHLAALHNDVYWASRHEQVKDDPTKLGQGCDYLLPTTEAAILTLLAPTLVRPGEIHLTNTFTDITWMGQTQDDRGVCWRVQVDYRHHRSPLSSSHGDGIVTAASQVALTPVSLLQVNLRPFPTLQADLSDEPVLSPGHHRQSFRVLSCDVWLEWLAMNPNRSINNWCIIL